MPSSFPDPDSAVDFLNERWFVVLDGGKVLVCEEFYDRDFERTLLRRSTFQDFRDLYSNITVLGSGRPKPLGELWLAHPRRRQYDGITCDPSESAPPELYNLWRGFNVDASKLDGEWDLLKEHIRLVICRGDEKLFEYHLNWFAWLVQNPHKQAGVALVWRGGQGAGKSMPAREVGKLFGPHFLTLTNPRHIVGNFNAHFENAVLVLLDEAFGTNDKTVQSAMKVLVTEPTLMMERKYQNAQPIRNRTHIIVCSNEDWVVPVGADDRRFCVVDVSDERRGQKTYFDAIANQMDQGGREAMYCELLARDLSAFDIRDRPETNALLEQKRYSQSDVEHWWEQKLRDEKPLESFEVGEWDDHPVEVLREEMREDYMQFLGQQRNSANRQLGIRLRKLVPWLKDYVLDGQPMWKFPSLRECRRHWDKRMKQKTEWPARVQDGASWIVR